MMKETFPCKVTAMNTAKPGKHGSAKAMIVAKDIFTDKQYEESFGTSDMISAPLVTKTEYLLLDLDDDQLTLMERRSASSPSSISTTESRFTRLEKATMRESLHSTYMRYSSSKPIIHDKMKTTRL